MKSLLPWILIGSGLAQVPAQKLAVYILAGQSNMQGHAKVETFGYLGDDPETAPLLRKMLGKDGRARACRRVWISYLTSDGGDGDGVATGRLTAGYGARRRAGEDGGKIGPEFTFGLAMEESHRGPVLLIKTAWGGKSLHTDFRPPSAGPYVFDERQRASLEKRGIDPKTEQEKKIAATGVFYRAMIAHVKEVLGNPGAVVPGWSRGRGHELKGFVWFQGWNDMVDRGTYPERDRPGGYAEYTRCLAALIRDVRKDLEAPDLPFVIGVMGVGGPIAPEDARRRAVHRHFREAMAAPAAMKEFRGTVTAVETAPFWDARLAAIDEKLGRVRQMGHFLRTRHRDHANADGQMTPKQQQEFLQRYRAELLGDEEEVWKRGASNAAYHYLGCAKTMARIGQAFADALLQPDGRR